MTKPKAVIIPIHADDVKLEALRLHREGISPRKVAAMLCLPYSTVRTWVTPPPGRKPPLLAKPKTKSGSGVIAGPAYARGYRWYSRTVNGW